MKLFLVIQVANVRIAGSNYMKKVEVLKDGPILLCPENGTNIALCRCGKTQNRPYCDGHHAGNGFKAKGETVWQGSTSTEKVLDQQ